jgi:crotonobetainyl-CoA:carnitine CoA-transferase CaiB-like acyl-CoA transferase
MKEGVRYQMYESSDGHVLFMASEQAFWKNFCEGIGRLELFEKWPGSKFADHARGNRELQRELAEIFKTKTSAEWIAFSGEFNTPIAPVNTPQTIVDDPQFQDRFPLHPIEGHGVEMLPFPVKFLDEEFPPPSMAPTAGEHNDQVLTEVLGYDAERIAKLKDSGALG